MFRILIANLGTEKRNFESETKSQRIGQRKLGKRERIFLNKRKFLNTNFARKKKLLSRKTAVAKICLKKRRRNFGVENGGRELGKSCAKKFLK